MTTFEEILIKARPFPEYEHKHSEQRIKQLVRKWLKQKLDLLFKELPNHYLHPKYNFYYKEEEIDEWIEKLRKELLEDLREK